VKSLKSLQARLRNLLLGAPNYNIFPQEPWDDADMEEIARIVENFVNHDSGVIDDHNPWKDWIDRWKFYCASRGG
jgi:hypothetical protein